MFFLSVPVQKCRKSSRKRKQLSAPQIILVSLRIASCCFFFKCSIFLFYLFAFVFILNLVLLFRIIILPPTISSKVYMWFKSISKFLSRVPVLGVPICFWSVKPREQISQTLQNLLFTVFGHLDTKLTCRLSTRQIFV